METGQKAVLGNLKRARRTGQLNLIGLELSEVPKEVVTFSTLVFDENWWELVPLSKLDLSNNSIGVLPEEIVSEKDLQVIRMQNNQLRGLPFRLPELTQLKSLDLSKNQLRSLPSSLVQCASLVEINFSENKLESLPDNMHYLNRLEILNVSKNELRSVPLFLERTPLKRVDLSENRIDSIPQPAFSGCVQLDTLVLSKNQISRIESSAFESLKSLVNLFLDQNKLATFDEVPLSEKLDSIQLSHNRITAFTQFANAPNLSALVLNNNKLTLIDKSILVCKNLKTLDLSNNDLPDIPSEIGLLPKLVRFQVEGNPLKCIRNTIKHAGAEVLKKYLKDRIQGDYSAVESALDPKMKFATKSVDPVEVQLREFLRNYEFNLTAQNLTAFDDPRYFEIKNLQALDLSNNKLKDLPEKLAVYARSLSKLIANNNQLTQLPNGLLQLQALNSLELRQNSLSGFFDGIMLDQSGFAFSALTNLDLSINKIRFIGNAITLGMPRLRVLNLAYNSISDLMPLLSRTANLQELEVIDLSNNSLTEIPVDIAYTLPMLQNLNCENNSLSKVPTELGFMNLKSISIDGNPLKQIKRAVIERGTVAILDYLRTRHVGDPPKDLACMLVNKKVISTEKPLRPQQNILDTNDYQYKRQNHQYGQLNMQPQGRQPQSNRMEIEEPEESNWNRNPQQQLLQQQQQRPQQQMQMGQFQSQSGYGQGFPQQGQQQIQQQQYGNGMGQMAASGPEIRANRAEKEKRIYEINGLISRLEREVEENFSLNKFQLAEKRRELQTLKGERARLSAEL